MTRMNFQDETSEQIKIHLKDKQIGAISSLLIDVTGASFAANVIHLVSPVSGDGSEVLNGYWSCTNLAFPDHFFLLRVGVCFARTPPTHKRKKWSAT